MGKVTDSELLTTGEAAKLLGTTRQHVANLCDSGRLTCVRSGTHRRVPRSAVEAVRDSTERLTREQERSLWLGHAVAGQLVRDPDEVLRHARNNLIHMQEVHPRGQAAQWLKQWEKLLAGPIDGVLEVLTSRSPRARELRQNSPFAGVLDREERLAVLRASRSVTGRARVNRQQLAHILRAASTITEDADVLLIGSQAILASHDDSELPDDAIASIEADVAFLDDPDNSKADLVDGNIGEGSHFQETHGYYGQGVSLETPTLPAGWRERIVMFDMPEALPSRARCLDKYDLVVSKLVAQREKDMTFAAALMHAGLISHEVLNERAGMLEDPVTRKRVVGIVEALGVTYAKEAPNP